MGIGTVAVVGSPNVGKSTIFNRIIGHRHSIIDDQPGVTRDRIYDKANWLGVDFNIIDTGGVEIMNRPFQEQIRAQATIAIEEADVIVFVADGKLGISRDDRVVAKMLYKANKPVILAVNKIDSQDMLPNLSEFYALGLGEPLAVSGEHGIGIGDLLDKIVEILPKKEDEEYDDAITFSIIGRPNVGKSSLSNAILNKERVIVSNIEGTTRDSIDTRFTRDGNDYVVIDTAGLKKRGKIFESVDKYSMLRALAAIDRSEIVLFVIDADTGIQEQDKHIVGYACDAKKAIIIVVNKWDTVEHTQNAQSDFEKNVRKEFQFLEYAPIVFVSAINKTKIDNIFKNPPSGTCVANMYDDKTLINVEAKSDANITEYTYIVDGSINSNGLLNSYTSKKILPKEISVKVVDEVNNSTVIKCDRKDNRKVNKYTPGITLHKTKNNLEYFLYLPESYLGTREKIPVIVYLHGSGMHTKSGEVGGLLEDVKVRGRKVDAIVLGPNADMDKKYPNASLYYGWRDRSADVVEMVDEVVSAYNGDVNRIYIAGGSVGAQGAFDILLKHPTVFRGIAVCNGPNYLRGFGSDDVAYKRLIDILSQNKIAVYLFRASGDQNVRSDGGYEIKYAIKKFGYPESEYKLNYDITVKGENTHRQAYLAFSESDYVDWLLQHK